MIAISDNRTTELRISEPLRGFIRHQSNRAYIDGGQVRWLTKIADEIDAKHEQAIAATLGSGLNPDGLPVGLTLSEDGTLLNWCGENYVRQDMTDDVPCKPNGDMCGDDRFALIDKAKRKLLDDTNIMDRPDEVAVLDSILFRCWQMGWLDQLRDGAATLGSGTCERIAELEQLIRDMYWEHPIYLFEQWMEDHGIEVER